MTGETPEEAWIRAGDDREVVPAEAFLEVPPLAVALARAQLASHRLVVAVRVGDGDPGRHPANVGDGQDDRVVVRVVARLDAEIGLRGGGDGAAERAQEPVRAERGEIVLALSRRPRVEERLAGLDRVGPREIRAVAGQHLEARASLARVGEV